MTDHCTTRPICVGVIGAGGNTVNKHIPGLLAQPGVTIKAVCNRTVASARKVCEKFNIPDALEDPQAIFADPAIDAVVIGTWPYKHCPFTVAALEAGKHVMCEARMAMNACEGDKMVSASRARPDLVAQIVPSPFTLPFDAVILETVQKRLGPLRAVRLEILSSAGDQPRPRRTWRLDRGLSGNNIMAVGIWLEAATRWVGRVACIQAVLQTHRPMGVDEAGREVVIDVPDHVEALGRLEVGGSFSLSISSVSTRPAGTNVWIEGEGGCIHFDGKQATFTPAGGQPQTLAADAKAGWRVEEEFVRAIRGLEPIRLTDFDTALAYMKLTDALHESNHLGQMVRV